MYDKKYFQFVNVKSTRNLTIMGLAIILGSAIPDFFEKHPVRTGVSEIDQVFNILLTIKMFVGGVIAFILDNSCGGATREERGLNHNSIDSDSDGKLDDAADGYSFPTIVNE